MIVKALMTLVVIYIWANPILYHARTGFWFASPVIIFGANIMLTLWWAVAVFVPGPGKKQG